MSEPDLLTLIIKYLSNPSVLMRILTAAILRYASNTRAIDHLITLLHDPNEDVRLLASFSLRTLGERTRQRTAFQRLVDEYADLQSPEVRRLIHESYDRTNEERLLEQDFDRLIVQLHDKSESVREHAAIALSKLNDERAIVPLIECFIDPKRKSQPDSDGDVSFTIPYCIKDFGDRAIPHLIPYLKDPTDAWNKSLLWLLIEMAEPSSVPALIEAHKSCEGRGLEGHAIRIALQKINTAEARAFLASLNS